MAQFRTKARAVDLLGKGQIADLPTAISELWKNGYDAYARNLNCDLYLNGYADVESPIFSLSDDGFGMTKNDILSKWIVLGTDSKSRGKVYLTDEQRFNLSPRTPMGEKGIGRLSVAYLGSPMLMLTKKKNELCQMLLMDWRILENYNLFVDDVNIPLSEFRTIEQFQYNLQTMKMEFLSNFQNNIDAWSEQESLHKSIVDSIISVNIPDIIEKEIEDLFIPQDKHGTRFLIFQPDEQLLDLAYYNANDDDSSTLSELKRSLSGIYNLFMQQVPDFCTSFNIRNENGKYDIIRDFFDHSDFEKADHYIKGYFDENGVFDGIIRVYKQTFPYKFRPIRLPGKTPYGPFKIELGEIEGRQKYSLLSPEEYDAMDEKTDKFGGLYIYRDNFRVLPYGRTDYDFLKFEERRSKSAGHYFFSHRNMYGYIAITRDKNKALTDKAGREGLIENKAYKEFKKNLIDFFIDVAKNFFASSQDDVTAHSIQMNEIARKNEKILEAEKKKAKQTKAKFNSDLKANEIIIRDLHKEIIELHLQLELKSKSLETTYNEYQDLSKLLSQKKEQLRSLKIQKPSRIKLSSIQEKKYTDYTGVYNQIVKSLVDCDSEISKVRLKFDVENLRKDYENNYLAALREITAAVNSYAKRTSLAFENVHNNFMDEAKSYSESFKDDISNMVSTLNTKEEYEKAIEYILSSKESILVQIDSRYSSFVTHIENLSFDIDDDVLIGWYKEQHKKLEEKLEATDELAQLGISAEIIDHELNVLHSQMASSIHYLGDYAANHSEISNQYSQLKVAFEHMEANYKMLQPLYRMSRRQKKTFTGLELLKSLNLFFASKIRDLEVNFDANDNFKNYTFFTFESVIYSTFINIINNALYWLIPVSNRKIYIEYSMDTEEILVMNNGEKIADKLLEDIFTLFFTRKSNGRGIGLYLARKNLNSIGLDIIASNDKEYNKLNGACFVIKPYKK